MIPLLRVPTYRPASLPYGLVAVLVTALGLGVLVWLIPEEPLTGDGPLYVDFVQRNLRGGAAPWHARRLLGPLLVWLSPFSPLLGFHLLTLASLAATSLLTWAGARALGFSEKRALVAIPLLFGTWAVAPNLREYALVDGLAWAFVAAVWLALLRQRLVRLALVGLLGVLAKEAVAVATLAAATGTLLSSPRTPRSAVRAAAMAAPSLVLIALLITLFPDRETSITDYLDRWWSTGLASLGFLQTAYLVFASQGALWLLIPRGHARLPAHVRWPATMLLVGSVALVGFGTPERMTAVAFPVTIACALAATRGWSDRRVWLLALANATFVARAGGNAAIPPVLAWGGLALACVVAASAYWPYVSQRLVGRPSSAAVSESATPLA